MMKFKLVGIGEVLWDLLPGRREMGGAPANFAYHARALGAESRIVSRVGNDHLGRDLIERMKALGVPTECMEVDANAPTGTVEVHIAPDGQPQFIIHENVAWDRISGEEPGRRAVAEADAVCFGTLAQRHEISRRTIRALLKTMPEKSLRILDVNLRQNFYTRRIIEESLALANVLKVNETELPVLAEIFQLHGDERRQVVELVQRFGLRVVACTRGGQGSLLYSEGRWSEHPGMPTGVVDTVGAGDSFTAALALGLLAVWPLEEIHHRATAVAAYVCSQPGGTPPLPAPVRAPFLAIRHQGAADHHAVSPSENQ
jgi:fructokinase